jgi:hypothetical protein
LLRRVPHGYGIVFIELNTQCQTKVVAAAFNYFKCPLIHDVKISAFFQHYGENIQSIRPGGSGGKCIELNPELFAGAVPEGFVANA